jgi:hypothetical protein
VRQKGSSSVLHLHRRKEKELDAQNRELSSGVMVPMVHPLAAVGIRQEKEGQTTSSPSPQEEKEAASSSPSLREEEEAGSGLGRKRASRRLNRASPPTSSSCCCPSSPELHYLQLNASPPKFPSSAGGDPNSL